MWSTDDPESIRPADAGARGAARATTRAATWRRAIREAAVAAAIVLAVAEGVALLILAGGLVPGSSLRDALKFGGLLFFLFHHVGLHVSTPSLSLPHGLDTLLSLPHGSSVDATVAGAFLLGTALVLWLMYRAGRALGGLRGTTPMRRGLWGAAVAVP